MNMNRPPTIKTLDLNTRGGAPFQDDLPKFGGSTVNAAPQRQEEQEAAVE